MVALAAFAAALEGQAFRPIGGRGRVFLLVVALSVFHPSLLVAAVGCTLGLTYALWDLRLMRGVDAV